MLSRDGTAKLTDFGLAKSFALPDSGLTAYGQVVGTPRYIAPEVLSGQRGGAAADHFSLGCIVYELLTGRPLFRSKGFSELIAEHMRFSIPRPDEVHLDPQDELYGFLRRSLAADPVQRTASLPEMAEFRAPVNWMDLMA
jgi:eukaryotic-like serine/threonine-protein kinase